MCVHLTDVGCCCEVKASCILMPISMIICRFLISYSQFRSLYVNIRVSTESRGEWREDNIICNIAMIISLRTAVLLGKTISLCNIRLYLFTLIYVFIYELSSWI